MISPVEDPVSTMNACPNLSTQAFRMDILAPIADHALVSSVADRDYPFALAIPR